jgi:hypothetical protein
MGTQSFAHPLGSGQWARKALPILHWYFVSRKSPYPSDRLQRDSHQKRLRTQEQHCYLGLVEALQDLWVQDLWVQDLRMQETETRGS